MQETDHLRRNSWRTYSALLKPFRRPFCQCSSLSLAKQPQSFECSESATQTDVKMTSAIGDLIGADRVVALDAHIPGHRAAAQQ